MMDYHILTIKDGKEENFLRRKTSEYDFKRYTERESAALVLRMKHAMREACGVGLSANQIGLDLRVFVAEIPKSGGSRKFYAIFNPRIEKASEETESSEEGCLSIPGRYGEVPRHSRIIIRGEDKAGKPFKIKAWGLLARVFQHEVDHLDGKLFTDRTKKVYEVSKSERLAKKQENQNRGE